MRHLEDAEAVAALAAGSCDVQQNDREVILCLSF